MLSISTVEEATSYLTRVTGREWTQSELFDIATRLNLSFRAVVPLDVMSSCWRFALGTGFEKNPYSTPSHPMLAMVYAHDIARVWQLGAARISHAEDRGLERGELNILASPITVTAAEIRIREDELGRILTAWTDAQEGRYWWRVPQWARPTPPAIPSDEDGDALSDENAALGSPSHRPWLVTDPRDSALPELHPWGVSARYFARQMVKDDPALLSKRPALAAKVSAALANVNIKKRGRVRSLDPTRKSVV